MWVEQTNTDRASLYRMTFTEADDAAILLNLGGYVGTSTMVNAHVTKVEGSRIAGYFDTTGRLWGRPPDVVRMFFAAEFSRPFDALRPFGAMADIMPTPMMKTNRRRAELPLTMGRLKHQ